MADSDHPEIEPPGLSSWLLSFLSVQRRQYEAQYAAAADEATTIERAVDDFERFSAELVTRGVIPAGLFTRFDSYKPGDPLHVKLHELLQYQIVQHRLEFDVAERVCEQLDGLDERVRVCTAATMRVLGYRPSPTALKYFERATNLFLAGYATEAIVMCGAVLEAALRARFPDEILAADGLRPIYKRTGDFSIQQRLTYEKAHPILEEYHRQMILDILSWRNDAVHVQPDLGPSPEKALLRLAVLLPVVLPEE